MAEMDFTIRYIGRQENTLADILSRIHDNKHLIPPAAEFNFTKRRNHITSNKLQFHNINYNLYFAPILALFNLLKPHRKLKPVSKFNCLNCEIKK